ncbi:DUF6207 family protein [Streptomyces sp. NPDC053069]|uniref:DUF6207 family protein n=1 Tax=Streptomyces sp. NPDC053069 TaxID=3365695 RepID=UPI0037CCE6AF
MVASNTHARSEGFGELVLLRDDATVFAFQTAIARLWGTSTAEHTTRDVGQSGVRLRMYTDLRQVIKEGAPTEPESTAT